MSEIKAIATIILPGRVMYSTQECVENPNLLDVESMTIDHNGQKEKIYIQTRQCKPAKQKINISEAAYKAMTGGYMPEKFHNKNKWNQMSAKQKLAENIKYLCADLGGISFTIDILQ